MRKEGYKQARIAECLARDPGTVSQEIRRNSGQRGYRHKQAQRKAEQRRFFSRSRIKFTPVMQGKIEVYLRDHLSPEQVTGVMRRQSERLSAMNVFTSIFMLTIAAGAASTRTCASAERSAGNDSDGRIDAEEYSTASA